MSFYYECCICNSAFKIDEAIDGFKDGYTQGFLCPKCGGNIEESEYPESHPKNSMVLTEWLAIMSLCFSVYAYIQKPLMVIELVVSMVAFILLAVVSRIIKSSKKTMVLLQTTKIDGP